MNLSARLLKILKCRALEVHHWRSNQQNKADNLSFDLAIIDADHSRRAVANDVSGLSHIRSHLMHDSFNPPCRRGMLDILNLKAAMHSIRLHSIYPKTGRALGRFAIAWKSKCPVPKRTTVKSRPILQSGGKAPSFSSKLLQLKHSFKNLK